MGDKAKGTIRISHEVHSLRLQPLLPGRRDSRTRGPGGLPRGSARARAWRGVGRGHANERKVTADGTRGPLSEPRAAQANGPKPRSVWGGSLCRQSQGGHRLASALPSGCAHGDQASTAPTLSVAKPESSSSTSDANLRLFIVLRL